MVEEGLAVSRGSKWGFTSGTQRLSWEKDKGICRAAHRLVGRGGGSQQQCLFPGLLLGMFLEGLSTRVPIPYTPFAWVERFRLTHPFPGLEASTQLSVVPIR